MSKRTDTTVVTERGQVSIPAELRRELDLTAGRRLLWERVSDGELRVVLLPEAEAEGAQTMRGFARRRLDRQPRRTAEWMRELRAGEG